MTGFSSLEIILILIALGIVVAIIFAALEANQIESNIQEKSKDSDDKTHTQTPPSKISPETKTEVLKTRDISSRAEKVSISHTHPVSKSKVIDLSQKADSVKPPTQTQLSHKVEPLTVKESVKRLEPISEPQGYRYWAFRPTQLRGGGEEDALQICCFHLFREGEWIVAEEVLNPGGYNPELEGPENANNNDTTTKWLDLNKGPLVYDLGKEEQIDSYNWLTANDDPERDPVAWVLEASNDGADWIVVDDRSSQPQDVSVDRHSWVGSDGERHQGFVITLIDTQ